MNHRINKICKIILTGIVLSWYAPADAQYLSNLHATKDSPIYTTYAAPPERSQYISDQAYQLMWTDPEKGLGLESQQGGMVGVGFGLGKEIRLNLETFYREPVINTSYSDLVKMGFYPFRYVRTEMNIAVFSSQELIIDIKITNEDNKSLDINLFPYLYLGNDTLQEIQQENNIVYFNHEFVLDNWMKQHQLPLATHLTTGLSLFPAYDTCYFLPDFPKASHLQPDTIKTRQADAAIRLLLLSKPFQLRPRESAEFRLIRTIIPSADTENAPEYDAHHLSNISLEDILVEDEKVYNYIPDFDFINKDHEALYWNAFTLMRQCMMPPEGLCNFNYYVFSREPKWGWGYGGQVFHESLVMLAYAYMDQVGSLNSQRVYMERQSPNGYINYRTGPYLNETIPWNDQLTSSAPWFNYINLELYKISGDMDFLREAYRSGSQFYAYFVSDRDTDRDGLCEWGGHATLESVRDARVAVWDKVGWPSNFECLDLNCMLVMEARSLAEMAAILGLKNDAMQYQTEAEQRAKQINELCWDDETGFYYHVDAMDHSFSYKDDNDLKIKEIIGLLPLWAGIANREQADLLVNSLTDKEAFWRSYGIPGLTAQDEYYNPIGYWNGPVWIPWQYLVFRGLIDYGYINEAKTLAEKVFSTVVHHLKKDHSFWEFYSADDLQAGWHKTYIWTGLVARMLIDLYALE